MQNTTSLVRGHLSCSSYFIKNTGKFNYLLIHEIYVFFLWHIRIYDNTKIFTAFYPFNILTINYKFLVQILQLALICAKYTVACFGNIKAQFVNNKPLMQAF